MGSATIQVRFGEDKYPIGRFILDRARALCMSRNDLVRRLGYHDIGSGHEALTAMPAEGLGAIWHISMTFVMMDCAWSLRQIVTLLAH